jgi:hypothetical protein
MTDTGQSGTVAGAARVNFKDPTTLLNVVTAFLVLCTLAAAAALVFRAFEYLLLGQIIDGTLTGDAMMEQARASDARVEATSGLRAVIFVATLVPFGMWIHRANKNARALGAIGMKASPGWAVGSYFVPVVNLFAPFIAMREIWRASANPGDLESAPGTPLLGWWWVFWLANGFSGWAAAAMLKHADTAVAAQHASLVAAAQNVFNIALNVVALLLLRRITANQVGQVRLAEVF